MIRNTITKWRQNFVLLIAPLLRSNLRFWAVAAVLAGFLSYYFDRTELGSTKTQVAESEETAATRIPAGFVLVPIEIANFESLDSILGRFGVVDLYIPNENTKNPPIKVAEKVRILRAPLNPSRFAVLAREEESPRLVSHLGPFIVVIQNRRIPGTGFVKPPMGSEKPNGGLDARKRKSRITVETVQIHQPNES